MANQSEYGTTLGKYSADDVHDHTLKKIKKEKKNYVWKFTPPANGKRYFSIS